MIATRAPTLSDPFGPTTRTPTQWCTLPSHVEEQLRPAHVAADHHVGVAVVVDISERGTTTGVPHVEGWPSLCGHLTEATVTEVTKEQLTLSEVARVAVGGWRARTSCT